MNRKVFVHRYRWSHDKLRRKWRRLRREGKAVVTLENKDGWLYEPVDDSRIK